MEATMIERWKKAVVHLECATDRLHSAEQMKRDHELRLLWKSGEISFDDFVQAEPIERGAKEIRSQGTALFIIHEKRRYLVTARHVIYDKHFADLEFEEAKKESEGASELERDRHLKSKQEELNNKVFHTIFRVPSIDELIKGQSVEESLSGLATGLSSWAPYTYSDPSLDLAIISLDQRNSGFAEELLSRGYIPIPSSDIADGPDQEGDELLAIGFPATSRLHQTNLSKEEAHWQSRYHSLPISSFGRVAMVHNNIPFFWADISIYPGNSGGPVIASNRLVGIVSQQATIALDQAPHINTRIPFGKIIKASYIHELLRQQIEKDEGRKQLRALAAAGQ